MTSYIFKPELRVLDKVKGHQPIEAIANEVGMFSASPRFVEDNGGALTNELLSKIPQDWFDEAHDLNLYPNIDVRIHRLYQDDYPAVPGWHCDGEYRKTFHSQPELNHVVPHRHIVATVSTEPEGVSLTEFVNDELSLEIDENSEKGIWEQVHHQVEDRQPETIEASDGFLYDFGSFTLHRCTPAKTRGWRLFMRASMWHKPYMSGEGALARQEYVYRLSEAKGW